jgi:hypothetical protein
MDKCKSVSFFWDFDDLAGKLGDLLSISRPISVHQRRNSSHRLKTVGWISFTKGSIQTQKFLNVVL